VTRPSKRLALLSSASHGLGRLDADRADSMTDEGGPPPIDGETGLTLPDEWRRRSMVEQLAAARAALERGEGQPGQAGTVPAAIWHWDLASGRVEWDERLKALFGHPERVTDAAWRASRIHPADRNRVETSLQRATIVNHGAVWSGRYRFSRADGSYAAVTERAYVVSDDAGPRGVLGALTLASAGRLTTRLSRSRSPSGPAARARRRA
jgi:PAS domain-containing protein